MKWDEIHFVSAYQFIDKINNLSLNCHLVVMIVIKIMECSINWMYTREKIVGFI